MTREDELQNTIDELRRELADLREHVAPMLELERLSPAEFRGRMCGAWNRVGELESQMLKETESHSSGDHSV